MDFIRPIGPVEREVDPVWRVEHTKDRDRDEERREDSGQGGQGTGDRGQEQPPAAAPPEGPVEGDDGHLHIDVRA